jgi:FkbH-like protein
MTRSRHDSAHQPIKCVVWDLDNTLWEGVLLEDANVRLRPEAVEVIKTLDARGILQSIASRNDRESAMDQLVRFDLVDYFLYPQITWGSKALSVKAIADALRFDQHALAFIDDQPFERDEVAAACPDVLVLDPDQLAGIVNLPEMNPEFVTDDAHRRRQMYQAGIARHGDEESFQGSSQAFLETLNLVLRISRATADDLRRLEELTIRTSQLNSTGRPYSLQALQAARESPHEWLLAASLDDRYGSYGTIGLALVGRDAAVWTIRLLVVSCRVLSRGVGGLLLSHILKCAHDAGAHVFAEFVPTSRNRMMYVTYRFAGFREAGRCGDAVLLEHVGQIPRAVPYVTTHTEH